MAVEGDHGHGFPVGNGMLFDKPTDPPIPTAGPTALPLLLTDEATPPPYATSPEILMEIGDTYNFRYSTETRETQPFVLALPSRCRGRQGRTGSGGDADRLITLKIKETWNDWTAIIQKQTQIEF